jgi:hypothetical protein
MCCAADHITLGKEDSYQKYNGIKEFPKSPSNSATSKMGFLNILLIIFYAAFL